MCLTDFNCHTLHHYQHKQVAYTAALIAFSKQVLGALKVNLQSTDETNIRKSLMTLFETQDVTSADITAQVG
jgi:hypothetical protein